MKAFRNETNASVSLQLLFRLASAQREYLNYVGRVLSFFFQHENSTHYHGLYAPWLQPWLILHLSFEFHELKDVLFILLSPASFSAWMETSFFMLTEQG